MPDVGTVTRAETAVVAANVHVLMIGFPTLVWSVAMTMRVPGSPLVTRYFLGAVSEQYGKYNFSICSDMRINS